MSDPVESELVYLDSKWYTPNEIRIIEERTGKPITQLMQGDQMKADDIQVVALVMKWRTVPDFPEDRAGDIPVVLGERPVPPTSDNGSELLSPLSSTTEYL